MSISVDSNLVIVTNLLGISATKIKEDYADASIEDILQAEAAQGNQAAIELASELMNDVNTVMEFFGLANAENKYAILSEMNSEQLQSFLPLMEEGDLNIGLYFFTEDKLMTLLEELPMEQLTNTVFEMFSQEEIVQLMPDDQLNQFLLSEDIDKNIMLKHLKSIPAEYLAQMLESVTGQETDQGDSVDMTKQIGQLNPTEYKDALTNMQASQKQQLTLSLGKSNEELFYLFDANAYTDILDVYKEKPDVVKAMNIIEPEFIIEMMKELPDDLLSYVITQLDTEDFAENLMKEHPEVMAKIIVA